MHRPVISGCDLESWLIDVNKLLIHGSVYNLCLSCFVFRSDSKPLVRQFVQAVISDWSGAETSRTGGVFCMCIMCWYSCWMCEKVTDTFCASFSTFLLVRKHYCIRTYRTDVMYVHVDEHCHLEECAFTVSVLPRHWREHWAVSQRS